MHIDPAASDRRTQLEALALARQNSHFLHAKTGRWFVLAGLVFAVIWAFAGATTAVYSASLSAILLLALGASGKIAPLRPEGLREAAAISGTIERDLLQGAVDEGAPPLRFSDRSPLTTAQVQKARVIRYRVDSIGGQRCLIGMHRGRTPCCAGYVEATQVVEVRRPQMPVKRVYERVFSGVIAVIDHPGTRGWVTLTPADTISVRGMIDAVLQGDDTHAIHVSHPELERRFTIRGSSAADAAAMFTPTLVADILSFCAAHSDLPATFGIHDDAITVGIPMPVNPFTLNNNPAMWDAELQRCAATARTLSALFDALRPAAPARLMEAS